MKLSDVALLLPGTPFRSRIESEADGVIQVVQARDLGVGGLVRHDGAAKIRDLPGSSKGCLKSGDVLLQPRGTRFSAAQFQSAGIPAVAAAPLLILRPDPASLVSEFLVAILMAPTTQAILRQSAVGTHVPQVPRQAIADLRIELPDTSSQIRLADLARLERREVELMDRLRDVRARFFDLAVKEVAKKARKRVNASGPQPLPAGASTPGGALSNESS